MTLISAVTGPDLAEALRALVLERARRLTGVAAVEDDVPGEPGAGVAASVGETSSANEAAVPSDRAGSGDMR